MTYYHGRSSSRPFYGNYIYITPHPEYAVRYSNDSQVYECELLCSLDKIFTLKNQEHVKLIKSVFGSEILNKFNGDDELDWSKLSYLSNDQYESEEDFFKSNGFLGIHLKEQEKYVSIYIFDQANVSLGKKVTIF